VNGRCCGVPAIVRSPAITIRRRRLPTPTNPGLNSGNPKQYPPITGVSLNPQGTNRKPAGPARAAGVRPPISGTAVSGASNILGSNRGNSPSGRNFREAGHRRFARRIPARRHRNPRTSAGRHPDSARHSAADASWPGDQLAEWRRAGRLPSVRLRPSAESGGRLITICCAHRAGAADGLGVQ